MVSSNQAWPNNSMSRAKYIYYVARQLTERVFHLYYIYDDVIQDGGMNKSTIRSPSQEHLIREREGTIIEVTISYLCLCMHPHTYIHRYIYPLSSTTR
jgi:hypothetical protein